MRQSGLGSIIGKTIGMALVCEYCEYLNEFLLMALVSTRGLKTGSN